MKKKITRTVTICDRCEREIYQYQILMFTCPICKRHCCTNCKSGFLEKHPDICKDCIKIPEVKKRRDKFVRNYYKRLKKEEEVLKLLKIDKERSGE